MKIQVSGKSGGGTALPAVVTILVYPTLWIKMMVAPPHQWR
jgi:hypothetical protein